MVHVCVQYLVITVANSAHDLGHYSVFVLVSHFQYVCVCVCV